MSCLLDTLDRSFVVVRRQSRPVVPVSGVAGFLQGLIRLRHTRSFWVLAVFEAYRRLSVRWL